MKRYKFIDESVRAVGDVTAHILSAYKNGRIEEEEVITNRFLGELENEFDGKKVKNVIWHAKTLKSGKNNKQESSFGADFFGVLDVNLPEYKVKKGFLVQAKIAEPNTNFGKADWLRLKAQCDKMLQVTPDSFVFLYSRDDIRVVPAIAVMSSSPTNPHSLFSKRVTAFYKEHFKSFIGDRSISAPHIKTLESIADGKSAITGIVLSARLADE